jgi:hypothetical protein
VEPAANALDFDRVKADLSSRTATLHHVPEGEVRVRVVTGSTVLCEGGLTVVDGETSDFSCNDRTMTVRGVVRVGDRSATGGMLQWMPSVEDVGPALIVTRRSTSGMQTQELFGGNGAPLVVPIGASGNFETDLLRPGHYEVVLSSDVGSLTMRAPIEIPSVEQFVTEIHFDAGTLRGVVVDGDGSPIDGAEVRELNAHAVAISDASGSFEIHSVALGTARVQARKGSKASAVLDVAIKTDTTDGVVVRLRQSTPRLHIRVLDENGVGASGAFVFVLSASSPPEIVTCDSSGNAQYTFADDAPSLPRFAAVRGDQWIFGSWLNEQTLSSGSITLQVPREAGEISLTSDGSSGVPGIATADGWPLSWLLSAIGARPYVSPAHPLRLPQLPAGTYVVSLGGTTRSVVVEGGRTTAVAFP